MRLSWIVFKLLSILFVSGCPSAVVTWLTVEQKNASKTYGILLSIRGTTVVTDFPFTRTTKFEKFPVLKLLEADLAPGIFFSCGLGILFYFFQSVTKPKLKYTFTLLSFFSIPKRVALRPLHYILRHYSYLRTFSSPLRRARVPFIWKCTYHASQVTHAKSCPLLSYVSHQKSSSINFDFRRQSKIDVQTFMKWIKKWLSR